MSLKQAAQIKELEARATAIEEILVEMNETIQSLSEIMTTPAPQKEKQKLNA